MIHSQKLSFYTGKCSQFELLFTVQCLVYLFIQSPRNLLIEHLYEFYNMDVKGKNVHV
jgi:hypothetical protein